MLHKAALKQSISNLALVENNFGKAIWRQVNRRTLNSWTVQHRKISQDGAQRMTPSAGPVRPFTSQQLLSTLLKKGLAADLAVEEVLPGDWAGHGCAFAAP